MKEYVFLVDKTLDSNTAYEEAKIFFNSPYGFKFHCANYNDCFSHFDYPSYREKTKDYYVFIGIK